MGILSLFVIAALAVVGILGAVWLVRLLAKLGRGKGNLAPHPAELDPESRRLLRPIEQLRASLAQVVRSMNDSPELAVLAKEASAEADALVAHAAKVSQARVQMMQLLKGKVEAETEVSRLQRELSASEGETKAALESALTARQSELEQYKIVQQKMDESESKLQQAQAVLTEIRAKLVASSATSELGAQDTTELGDMLIRLKALGTSLDEAGELLDLRN